MDFVALGYGTESLSKGLEFIPDQILGLLLTD
jgi:hypothetical protein